MSSALFFLSHPPLSSSSHSSLPFYSSPPHPLTFPSSHFSSTPPPHLSLSSPPLPSLRLSERCKSNPQMEREGGITFIESLVELLRRLLDYRTVQQGDEYRDLHMHVMFNLLVRV